MRKIVAGFACSLDGYIEGVNGAYDWILIDEEMDFAEQSKRYDTYFYGRKTYEAVSKMGAADPAFKHFVFSGTLKHVNKGYTVLQGDIQTHVAQIKNTPGKDIAVYGGADLLTSLLKLHLIDELAISFIPVLLGAGKPMVSMLDDKVWLKLTKTKTYKNGTVVLTYSVKYNNK